MHSTGYRIGIGALSAAMALGLAGAPPAAGVQPLADDRPGPTPAASAGVAAGSTGGGEEALRPGGSSATAPTGDITRRRWAVAGQVYLSGRPVVGARVRVSTVDGDRLDAGARGSRRTDKQGWFSLSVPRRLPHTLLVTAVGGRSGTRSLGGVRLRGYGRSDDGAVYVNMGSSLLVDYHRLHPRQTMATSIRRVAGYLRLSAVDRGDLMEFNRRTAVEYLEHDPQAWYRRAVKHGGVDRYVSVDARRIRPGRHVRPSLAPTDYELDTYGRGGTVFDTGAKTSTLTRSGQPRGLISDAISGVEGLVEWGLGNFAQSEACQVAGNSNLGSAILACPSSASAADTNAVLDQMSQQLADIDATVDSLVTDVTKGALASALTAANVKSLQAAAQQMNTAFGVVNKTPAQPLEAQNPNQTPPSPSSTPTGSGTTWGDQVCEAAYQTTTVGASTAEGQCKVIGEYLWTTKGSEWDSAQTFQQAMNSLFQGLTGWNLSPAEVGVSSLQLTGQAALGATTSTLLQGQEQNALNQTLAQLVNMQAALMQMSLAAQAFYETWMTGKGPLYCTYPTNPSDITVPPTSAVQDANTCEIATTANTVLSVEDYLQDNGAVASLPNLNTPTTVAKPATCGSDCQGPGVVLDTMASLTNPPVYWAMPVDLSGASLIGNNGSNLTGSSQNNPWWPYYPQGAPPGASTTTGYSYPDSQPPPLNAGVVPGSAVINPVPIVNAYPDVTFGFAQEPSTSALVSHAWSDQTSAGVTPNDVNEALANVGFVGAGMNMTDGDPYWNGMNWSYLVTNIYPITGASNWLYPTLDDGGVSGNTSCLPAGITINWPPSSFHGVPTGYTCTDRTSGPSVQVAGTWGTTWYNTAYSASDGGTNPQACPSAPGAVTDPQGAPVVNVCVGPGSTSAGETGGSYYGLLQATNITNPIWTAAMFAPFGSGMARLSIPSWGFNDQLPQATVISAILMQPGEMPLPSKPYLLTGSVTTPQSRTSATVSVTCQYAANSSNPTPITLPAQLTTQANGYGVQCVTPSLAVGTTYLWRIQVTQTPVSGSKVPGGTLYSAIQEFTVPAS